LSLTSLIDSDKELKAKFKSAFTRPKLEKKPLLVEPHTKSYGLVGTAFDYLFRFNMERINQVADNSTTWIAEETMEWLGTDNVAFNVGTQIISETRALYRRFQSDGKLSTEFIRQILRMSYIDPVFRSGYGAEYIGRDADAADIEDVLEQYEKVDWSLFEASTICLLGPTFGDASRLVGGADADLLIDDKLIDIKTTKNLQLKPVDFYQIIGYLVLHRISGIGGRQELAIEQLGFYFSRYAYLFLFRVEDIIDEKSLISFTEWFEDRISSSKLG
jgi:hypothetical protein